MWKKVIAAILILLAVVAGLGYLKYMSVQKAIAGFAKFAPPPEAVTTTVASEEPWEQTLNAVGTLTTFQGVTISAEEAGKVVTIGFESGAQVKKGDLLVKMDTAVEEAQLKSLEARLQLTRSNFERIKELRKNGVSAQSDLDDADSQFKQAEADAGALRERVLRKNIYAPFTGRVGIRQINQGQYLAAGAPVVDLQSLNPIYANFTLPQRQVDLIKAGQPVRAIIDAFGARAFEGKITAISPQVDDMTRSIQIQATLDNSEEKLRPGMFATIHVVQPQQDKAITLPATSVSYAPYGDSVYIVEKMKNDKGVEYSGVRQQFVKLGLTRGDQVQILTGVKPGEEIVTSGLFKLRPGAAVQVNNSVQPANSATPNPSNS